MQETQIINFRKKRDFGQKLNATFAFISQNFQGLLKSIVFIAGPVVLVGSVFLGFFIKDIMTTALDNADLLEENIMGYVFQGGIGFIFLMVGQTLVTAIINEYVAIYVERNTANISVEEVWERVKKDFLMILISTIGMFVLIMIGFLFLIIPGIYLSITLSMIFIMQITERIGFFAAVSRLNKLITEKWWSTFGLLMVAGIIQGIISIVFRMPLEIIFSLDNLHDIESIKFNLQEMTTPLLILGVISMALYMIATYVLSTIQVVAIAFQYFNLVERKESVGLMSKIEDFGKEEAPESDEEDEETY